MDQTLEILRRATKASDYEGRVFLVGGIVRDKVLHKRPEEDIDIVLEGDAAEFARFLHDHKAAGRPVIFPRFGTAMITVAGKQVELVGARKESYDAASRKPSTSPGTLLDDVLRRDFTINTLLENLHTGEILDLTGEAISDIRGKIIRTPRNPLETFDDDPLRMLRAVRFSARLGFEIHSETYSAIIDRAPRLAIVSGERIREEFVKILLCARVLPALEMLRETGLLDVFAPELAAMNGVTQNIYHIYDVWTHTIKIVEAIPARMGIILRLAALLHDVGKPSTKSTDENGAVHFYHHEREGAQIARRMMQRLKFSNSEIDEVAFLISMHLRVGEYRKQWSDAAVRRLIRDAGDHLDDLILLTQADKAASNPRTSNVDLAALRHHIAAVRDKLAGQRITSPLDGREIIKLLGIDPGPQVKEVKNYLENLIIEGDLLPGDKAASAELIIREFGNKKQ